MKKPYTYFAAIFIGLIVLLVIAAVVANPLADKWFKNKLADLQSNTPGLSFGHSNVNIFERSLELDSVKYADSTMSISSQKITVSGIGLFQAITNKNFTCKEIAFVKPKIILMDTSTTSADSTKQQSAKKLPKLSIANVVISDGEIHYYGQKKSQSSTLFNAEIGNLESDSSILSEMLAGGHYNMYLSQLNYVLPDSLYSVEVDSIHINSQEKLIHIDSIHFFSNYDKYEIGHVVNHEIDWADATIPVVDIKGLNSEKLLRSKELEIESVSIDSPILTVFRDKRLPFPEDKQPKLLHETLAASKTNFKIDSIFIRGGKASYQEFIKQAVGPGVITFSDLFASFYNVQSFKKDQILRPTLDVQARVMDAGLLEASFTFPTSIDGFTNVKGKMSSMELNQFNPMLQYVGFVKIKSGRSRNLSFEFVHDQTHATGQMHFAYEDLKIDIIGSNTSKQDTFAGNVKSFLANTLVVRTNNTMDKGKFRIGEIDFDRNMEKSMFNFWWKSLLTGFRSSTGIEQPDERIDVN